MGRRWAVSVLGLIIVALLMGCTSTNPPASFTTTLPAAISGTGSPATSSGTSAPTSDPSSPAGSSATATASRPGPMASGSLVPGARLGIRYSGTEGLLFGGTITALFDDGTIVPRDASDTLRPEPIVQGLGETIVAVRVTGTIESPGTYLLEIVSGHLEGRRFVVDGVLATDEATGIGEVVQVDYGNVDL